MPGLLDFRKLWPNDFAMEPQPVYADKEAEHAGQLLKDAAQQKYGEPDPAFSFSHLSDYLASAGEAAGKAAGLPQYSEANPPPWAEGAASHAPQAAPNITAEDITSGRWKPAAADYLGKEASAIGSALNAPYEATRTLSNIVLGQGGTDQGVQIGADGQPIRHGGGLSGVIEGWKGQLTQSPLETWQRASTAGEQADRSIAQRGIGGINPKILGQPVLSTTERTLGDPLLALGGGEALGAKGLLKLGGSALAGSVASGYANENLPQDMNPVLRGGLVLGAGAVAGGTAYNADALAGVGKKIFTGTGPLAGERGSFDFGQIGKISDRPPIDTPTDGGGGGGLHAPGLASEHPTARELGGPAPEAPGKPPLSAEQELIQKAIRSSEQMDPQRQAELRSLRAAQGSGYYNEYKTALERTGDPALAHDIATQATAGTAGFTQAADTIPSASVPTLREQVLAARERDVNPINDFEMRRANIMLSEAEQNGARALGPQNERDLWAKIVGLSPEGDVNFPISDVKSPAPTMTLPGFDLPPQAPLPNPNDPFRPPSAPSVPDYSGAGPQPPDSVFNATTGKWEPKPAEAPAAPPAPPQSPIGNPDVPVQGQGIVATDSGLHVAGTEPGIYDASVGWGPATPAELANPDVMASRRALVERDLGMVEQRPNAPTVEELTRQDAAINAARSEADKALIRADPSTLTPSELGRRDYLLSAAEPGPTLTDKAVGVAKDIANSGIPAKAGVDVSYVLRQSLPLLARNLIFDRPAAAKALKTGIGLLKHPTTADAVTEAMINDKAFGVVTEKMGVKLNAVSAIKDDALVRDPIFARGKYNPIRKAYDYTERANELYLDTLRYQTAKGMLETLIKKAAIEGGTVSDEALKQVGTAINHGTGRGTGRWVDWLSSAPVRPLFSAQNLMAKPQMIMDMFKMEGPAQQLAIQQTIAYGAAIAGFNALVWSPKLLGLPHADIGIDRDPNGLFGLMGGNFARAQLGANSVDLSGGFAGNVRSAAQYAGSLSTAIGADKYGVPGYNRATSGDILSAWGRGKLSPALSFVTDNLVAHENYDKTPVDWKSFGGVATQLNNAFGNLGINDIVKAGREELAGRETVGGMAKGALSTFALGALALLGAGLNSGLSPSEQRTEARDAATQRLFPGQKYDDLLASDKAKINQDPTVKGFDSQVQNAPGSKIGEATLAFDKTMQDARDNFTTTKPDGSITVTDGVGYRKAFQDAAKTRHDFLAGAGVGEGKDDVLNGWYALYNAPGIQKQLQAKDYSGIDALQEQYTAAHPEIVDKLAKSVGAKDDPVMQQMRAAAAEAKQYYAIPKYRGLSEQDATTADKILAKASSMVNNRQAGSQAAALAALVRDGYYSPEQVGLARRASALPTNPERKQFQLSHPLFATFYKGADASLGDVGAAGAGTTGGLSGGLGGGLTGGLR